MALERRDDLGRRLVVAVGDVRRIAETGKRALQLGNLRTAIVRLERRAGS